MAGDLPEGTPDQLWKLTRPDNRHDKLTPDNLLDLEGHHPVRIESVQEDQRQVWVLTARGHHEAKKLLEPRGVRVPAGLAPVAFVFADITAAKVANMVAALESEGRRYWAPRYETQRRGIMALDYHQAVPVVVTTLEQLQEHGAGRGGVAAAGADGRADA